MDSMNACVKAHNDTESSPKCAVVTDMLELKIKPGPAGLLFQPIFPANDPTEFVGFATTSLHWEEVITNTVPDYVNGLTCVVSTATASYTYEIRSGGQVALMGSGDLHDVQFDDYAQSVVLAKIETGANTSAVYTLTVYPTVATFSTFSTNSPLGVALAFTGVIFLCMSIFFFYDFLMRHEAEQRRLILEMKRRFVRFISHEIRTPLNTVCIGLELLEKELRKDKSNGRENNNFVANTPAVEDVDFWHSVTMDVKENAAIAISILNDILNYDKLESKTLELEAEEVNIRGLVEDTVRQFHVQAVDRGIDLKLTFESLDRLTRLISIEDPLDQSEAREDGPSALFDIESNNLCVIGDDVRLSQVFRNIISNALKFTPTNGNVHVAMAHVSDGLPVVEDDVLHGQIIGKDRRRGSVVVCVSDTGVGLTKEQVDMLFGEGVQFDANKLQHGGGSGLGLNIAKGIVELHHGTINAYSRGMGLGTSFVIELPLYEISSKGDSGEEKLSHIPAQTEVGSCDDENGCGLKKRSILVVEDAASSRKMVVRFLEREGHICTGACNGRDAVEMIEHSISVSRRGEESGIFTPVSFDTILMDYEMPFMNGPDATLAIRGLGYKGTIIGLTGNVLLEDVEHFKACGADEVFGKPIRMDALTEFWNT